MFKRAIIFAVSLLAVICISVRLGGCAPQPASTQPTSVYDRGQRALDDPANYEPSHERHDITGGGIGDYDNKGMQRDLDHVLNP